MSSAWALSPEQLEAFHRDGCLVIANWWDADTVSRLRAEAERVRDTVPLPPRTAAPFTTGAEQGRGTRADHFLSTGECIGALLEESAYEGGVPKALSDAELRKQINKVGHRLHDLNPVFREVSLGDARIAAICGALGYNRAVVPQSMVIYKAPGVGGAVGAHVDGGACGGVFSPLWSRRVVLLVWGGHRCFIAPDCTPPPTPTPTHHASFSVHGAFRLSAWLLVAPGPVHDRKWVLVGR